MYEKRYELTEYGYLKAKEGEEMKRIVGEYRELLKKQEEIINSTKKSRDRVPGLVWNHT